MLATLLDATMRGLIVTALPLPELAAQRTQARPFGALAPGQWSLAAIGLGSLASEFLEPDPAVTWDDERVAALRQALLAAADPGA